MYSQLFWWKSFRKKKKKSAAHISRWRKRFFGKENKKIFLKLEFPFYAHFLVDDSASSLTATLVPTKKERKTLNFQHFPLWMRILERNPFLSDVPLASSYASSWQWASELFSRKRKFMLNRKEKQRKLIFFIV